MKTLKRVYNWWFREHSIVPILASFFFGIGITIDNPVLPGISGLFLFINFAFYFWGKQEKF